MTHKVESSPYHSQNGWPWIIIPDATGRASIRITSQALAERVAKALDLLDEMESGPQIVLSGDINADLLAEALSRPRRIQIVPATRPALPEDEIMQRAREALIASGAGAPDTIRNGFYDKDMTIRAAVRALRDLTKPLAEIVPPPVDPDLIEARKIAAKMFDPPVGSSSWIFTKVDGSETEEMSTDQARQGSLDGELDGTRDVQAALAAIKRGRELADSPMERLARQLGVSPHQC